MKDDPRWRRLWAKPFTCPTCDEQHLGLMDLACDRPDQLSNNIPIAPNSSLDLSRTFLSEDFAVLDGEHFFVRALLELPILGSNGEHFGFGVWSSLARNNFEQYIDTFDSGEQDGLGPWFGWFSNELNGYPDTFLLKCHVHPKGGRQRPTIEFEPTDHPLVLEQREGMTFDRLLEIYAIHGHDIRQSLVD